ncbi:MAG: hypothetical protein HUK24_06310, partial [Sphaerochaetaceae bacterium]|nr:hypothetical protein [Sphaerochaetaceae bacterium]
MRMIVDIDRCWGCKSCQVSCKSENLIPPGFDSNISVFRIETQDKGRAACDFIPVMCQQCNDPTCLKVCPVGAISRNSEDLIVV